MREGSGTGREHRPAPQGQRGGGRLARGGKRLDGVKRCRRFALDRFGVKIGFGVMSSFS